MSAYALPGLFPSLEVASCFPPANKPCPLTGIGSFAYEEEKVDYEPLKRQQQPKRNAQVTVRAAKLDPLRLIKSLTASSSSNSPKSPKRKLSRSQQRKRSASVPTTTEQSRSSAQETVMEFELSIRCDGRQYSATRSLARIRQLEVDLRKEVQNQVTDSLPRHKAYHMEVPDLPLLQKECSNLGFTLLQDVLESYAPALEDWFVSVLVAVPKLEHSHSLADFFYEPQLSLYSFEHVLSSSRRKAAPARLDSIDESEADEEEKVELM